MGAWTEIGGHSGELRRRAVARAQDGGYRQDRVLLAVDTQAVMPQAMCPPGDSGIVAVSSGAPMSGGAVVSGSWTSSQGMSGGFSTGAFDPSDGFVPAE